MTSLGSASSKTSAEKNTTEICLDLSACKTIKTCHKIHPKVYRRFSTDKLCRFGNNCVFFHPEQSDLSDYKCFKYFNKEFDDVENTVLVMGQ